MEQNKKQLCFWFVFVAFLSIVMQLGMLVSINFTMAFSLMFSLCFMYAYTGKEPAKLLIYSLALSFLVAIPCTMYLQNSAFSVASASDNSSSFTNAYTVFKFFAFIFFYSWFRDKAFPANYSSLVKSSWNTIACGFLVVLIMIPLAILLLIVFGVTGEHLFSPEFMQQLSNIKDPNQFYQILNANNYKIEYLLIAFFSAFMALQLIAFMIAKTHQSWIDKFEHFILGFCRYVFIIMSFVGLVHVAYYMSQVFGFQPANNILLNLLNFAFFAIVFFNGFYQDGNSTYQSNGFVSFVIKLFRLMFFLCSVVVITKYIGDAGFNMNQNLWTLFMVLYLGLYGITAFMSADREKALIQTWNTRLALLYIVAFTVLNIALYLR